MLEFQKTVVFFNIEVVYELMAINPPKSDVKVQNNDELELIKFKTNPPFFSPHGQSVKLSFKKDSILFIYIYIC